jgi:hypothetical protein
MNVRVGAVAAAALVALTGAARAAAALGDEIELAERHAPVVRLVEQLEECGPGEPYEPMDVDALFDEPTVALRGPWNALDLIEVGPTADDLADLYEYHLDFPGAALDPGCSYERWANRVTEGHAPTVYAHVATDPDRPGQLALQYWLFYAYNDWNNLHEGDWETVQLIFDAADARAALAEEPVAVGYSQHEGTERAEWDDEKLELVGGRRPVVYPAAGSHANFYDDALFLGSSAEQGVGCDDTRGPHDELDPAVVTIPSDAAARSELPWITFEGRWGELQEAFFNGPTGPNMKRSWREPIVASEEWRDRAYAVPTGGLFGTQATDGFCSVVARGSSGLVRLLRDPGKTLLLLAALLALAAFATTRTTWRPTAPLRVGRRRAWGQILAGAGRMYLAHARLFIGIGLLLIPVSILIAVLQALVFGGLGRTGVDVSGEGAGALALFAVAVGTALTLFGVALVQAATACALVRLDEGGSIGPIEAYQRALLRARSLFGATAIAVALFVALSATIVLAPVAIWLAVRFSLLAQVVELEGLPVGAALRRSGALVRRRWFRVAAIVGLGTVIPLAVGTLLGTLLILATQAPLALANVVAGVINALAMPFVALTTTYLYFDARARLELETEGEPGELPPEISLSAP